MHPLGKLDGRLVVPPDRVAVDPFDLGEAALGSSQVLT